VKTTVAAKNTLPNEQPESSSQKHLIPSLNSGNSANASDDEILGLIGPDMKDWVAGSGDAEDGYESGAEEPKNANSGEQGKQEYGTGEEAKATAASQEGIRELFEANPDLRRAWNDARAYREAFATPEEARQATALIGDLNRMDALFFSSRPEDHLELARSIAALDPNAFTSLAKAMNSEAGKQRPADASFLPRQPTQATNKTDEQSEQASERQNQGQSNSPIAGLSQAQAEFLQATNAAAVQGVIDAIQTQVERLIPEGASKATRNRVVGEIYRELDTTLRENQQLAQQVRDAFRFGVMDANHQRAIVSLISGRARQALPGVAKKVMDEWTSTVLAANQDRRARQRAAERRVDIAGSGGAANDGRRVATPRNIDYSRMSDSDILNL
jgi:hypothetical protein